MPYYNRTQKGTIVLTTTHIHTLHTYMYICMGICVAHKYPTPPPPPLQACFGDCSTLQRGPRQSFVTAGGEGEGGCDKQWLQARNVYMYAHLHIHVYVHVYNMHAYVYTGTYIHIGLCICVCMHDHACMCICVSVHVYIYICMYVCVHMYTHTCTMMAAAKGLALR